MNIRKILLITLIAVAIVASVSAVSASIFSFFGWENEITLTQESTGGVCDIYDDGDTITTYSTVGILKGLPDNVENYVLKTAIYDRNGKLIDEEKDDYSLEFIADSSKQSEIDIIGDISIEGFKNVSLMELTIVNPDGKVVFEKNVTFAMENVTIEHINETEETVSDDNENIDYDNPGNPYNDDRLYSSDNSGQL